MSGQEEARFDLGIDIILNSGLLTQHGITEAFFKFVDGEITEAEFRAIA